LAAVGALALAAGLYAWFDMRSDASQAEAVSRLAGATFPDLAGEQVSLERWRGKVLVVNFWASWCAPCRDEIPGLLRIQQKYAANGLQIVGIAVDTADKSRDAARAMGISYPVLVGGAESIDLARRFGNRAGGLPYTVVLDQRGALVMRHLGILTEAELEQLIQPLLG